MRCCRCWGGGDPPQPPKNELYLPQPWKVLAERPPPWTTPPTATTTCTPPADCDPPQIVRAGTPLSPPPHHPALSQAGAIAELAAFLAFLFLHATSFPSSGTLPPCRQSKKGKF